MKNRWKSIALFMPSLHGGGAERSMIRLAESLSRDGTPVDLLVASSDGPYRADVSSTVRLIDLKARRTARALFPLAAYLRKAQPTALLSTMTHANVIAIVAAKLARSSTRVVLRETTILSTCLETVTGPRGRLVMRLAKAAYPMADAIVAISHGVAEDLSATLNLPRSPIHVIYNPVVSSGMKALSQAPIQEPWFEPGSSPVILGVGRLDREKDFATLIRAFARLKQKISARLIILGEGPQRGDLERVVDQLGMKNDISMPGFVNNPLPYMAKASVLAMTSWFEGLGNVLIEALACGTPVVATDCPTGPREILENGKYGRLVPVGDSEALAEALIATIADPPPPALMEEAAARFAVDTIAQHYLDVMFR